MRQFLSQLDDSVPDEFPTMDHPDNFLASTRLTVFGNEMHGALVIEQLVCATSAGDYNQFQTLIYTYGDKIIGKPGMCRHCVHPITEGNDGFLFQDVLDIRPDVRTVRIRSKVVHFDASPNAFAERGIKLQYPPEIGGWDLLRLLVLDHRDQLLATDAERRNQIALPLPQLLQLDKWHHPDVMAGEMPSDTRCFRMLAEVLATGDPSLYRPIEAPNTDWHNWPRAGML